MERNITAPWKKTHDHLDSILKSRDITLPTKVCLVKAMVFPVVIYRYESWTIKKADHWRIDAFELWCWRRLSRVPLDCKEIQPVHPEGNQSWIFIGRTDDEVEAPILWPPDVKNWLIGKDPDAGKDWMQKEKGTTEDEMIEWHHRLNGREFEQSSGRWWTGKPGVLKSMGSQSWTRLSDWTDKKQWSSDISYNMNNPWKHYTKWDKPDTKGQILYDSTYMKYLEYHSEKYLE